VHEDAGPKAWEGVCIRQAVSLAWLGHTPIMPDFPAGRRREKPMKTRISASLSNNFTHTKAGRPFILI
jgi:hypothetical protein